MERPEELLKALSEVKDVHWVRLLYLYPDGITPEMIALIKNNKKLVKYFDIPLQHINDDLLKAMNRKMTRKEVERVLENLRREIPDSVIRTQFIVGFPGETEEQFQELLSFVKKQKFDRVGCFKFSQEESTVAGKAKNQIDEKTKQRRHDELMAAQQEISKKKHKKYVGKVVEVLVEGFSEETELLLQGRTSQQAPDIDGVVLINEGQAKVGEIVKVKITGSMEYDLIGRILE